MMSHWRQPILDKIAVPTKVPKYPWASRLDGIEVCRRQERFEEEGALWVVEIHTQRPMHNPRPGVELG